MIHRSFFEAEIDFMVAFQNALGPALDPLFIALTRMGDELFYIAIIPLIYWCIDRRTGLRLLVLLQVSSFLNTLLKWSFHSPRPYWFSTEIRPVIHENSFCPPSGHAQNADAVWFFLAYSAFQRIPRAWIWIAFGVLAFLISISRTYLGVHFPHSTALGWLFGAVVLFAFVRWAPRFEAWFRDQSLGSQAAFSFAAAALMLAIMQAFQALFADTTLRPEWILNAARAPGADFAEDPLTPFETKGIVSYAAVIAGGGLGGALMLRQAPFDAGGPILKRILRYVAGLAGILALMFAIKAIEPEESHLLYNPLRFLRYFAMILWGMWLAPVVFLKLGLAARKD